MCRVGVRHNVASVRTHGRSYDAVVFDAAAGGAAVAVLGPASTSMAVALSAIVAL